MRMRLVLAAAALVAAAVAAGTTRGGTGSPLSLSPITAKFVPAEFATHYTVVAKEPGKKLSYKWTLNLQLVDKLGAAGESGAKAGVDAKCSNRGVLSSTATSFVWHHGSSPQDHCDHAKMGPSGHEGLVMVVVSDGTWACTAAYKGTNDGKGGAATCAKLPAYSCVGQPKKLLDTSNVYGVQNGGRPPSFLTFGKAYCLTQIVTYHWNNGQGAAPGTLALKATGQTVGPFQAKASAGSNNAPNVNWYVNVPTSPPVVIDGAYSCVDSDPRTWSQNQQSHGTGFCQVYGIPAVKKSGGSGGGATTAKTTTAKPTTTTKAGGKGGKGKLSIKASPDNGNPPLKVTFTLSSPKVVQWRIDYGDGQSKVGFGSPPATIAHTYARAGDYKPRLSVLATPTANAAQTATTSITVGTSLMSFGAKPTSGSPPLKVTFTLGTSVRNITTWSVDFGDGQHTGGAGKPPATVAHTYAKACTCAAVFAVKPGAYAVVAAYAQVVVGGGTPPTLSLTASPTSGTHPLAVTFTLATNIPGNVVSWQLQFGDGTQATGSGKPPATVRHTYAKKGTFLAFLVVAQQQQYGGVQYVVPRNGLAVSVK